MPIRQWARGICLLAVSAALLLPFSSQAAETFSIAVYTSSTTRPYIDLIEAIDDQVTKASSPRTVTFQLLSVDEQISGSELRDALNKSDLILSIGNQSTRSIFALNGFDKPILSTLIPKRSYYDALENADPGIKRDRISAIFIDNPVERQLILASEIAGKRKTIGLLTGNSKSSDIKRAIDTSNKLGIRLYIEDYNRADNLITQISNALVSSDVFLALPEPEIFNRNTARNILLTSYRHRKPLIGFSRAYVDAGALAAVYSTPEQIAAHSAEVILELMKSNGKVQSPAMYPRYFSVSVNWNVARSLGVSPPSESRLERTIRERLEQLK